MIVLGIDPGKTIGLCLYDTDAQKSLVAECRTIAELDDAIRRLLPHADRVAVERPRMYRAGGNEIADTCEQAGWIVGRCGGTVTRQDRLGGLSTFGPVLALERRAVTSALGKAVGQQVQGDAGVWAALVQLHGPDAMRAPQDAVAGRPYLPRIQSVTATKTRAAVQGQREQTAIEARPAVLAGPLYGVASHARQALAVAWAAGQVDDVWLTALPF